VGDGGHYDAIRIHYQHINIVKFIPVIQRRRNVGDAHAAGAEPMAEPPRALQYKSNDFYRAKFSSQTLPKKFQPPPKPLLKTREPINQTMLKNFQSDSARKILSRPWLQKVKRICLNQKPENCLHVAGKTGK
jgi:hypothetical protein